MTTLAYKDGILAFDSRITTNDVIVSNTFNKGIKTDQFIAAIAGDVADAMRFLNFLQEFDYGDDEIDVTGFIPKSDELHCLLIDKRGNVTEYFVSENSLHKIFYGKINEFAAGSGGDFALAAMDCGLSAEQAVKAAMKRDPFTGGKINKLKIKDIK